MFDDNGQMRDGLRGICKSVRFLIDPPHHQAHIFFFRYLTIAEYTSVSVVPVSTDPWELISVK